MRMLLVVAHPDDEILGAGIWLRRHAEFETHLLHITDGSPRDLQDARAAGFHTRRAYALARKRELIQALGMLSIPRGNCHGCDYVDKEAYLNLPAVSRQIDRWIETLRPSLVISHAYEGGHPDHDAVAFAVAMARRRGRHFQHLEFPLYHGGPNGEMIAGEFLTESQVEQLLELSPAERRLKSQMLDCFRTQAHVIRQFPVSRERFRDSPHYDFSQAPHPGPLLYERWGWGILGSEWRTKAREAEDYFFRGDLLRNRMPCSSQLADHS
uniref:LmbE-like protein n=1 Tax=Solibacter usitatus (strain Ellin6076) TaxID=234267 RepID=Q022U3_SOLUE